MVAVEFTEVAVPPIEAPLPLEFVRREETPMTEAELAAWQLHFGPIDERASDDVSVPAE